MEPDPTKRRRFTRTSDWHAFLGELQEGSGVDLYALRKACYQDIEAMRERPLLVYAAKFPDAAPAAPISIDLNDVDGFTDLIASVPESEKRVDVLLHSPGGSPEATERIVGLLRKRFESVVFLVPHSAYSAATMLALSGDEIILHPSATLGPIDPQINGTPARSIRRGFDKVRELLKEEGPEALPAYIPLIEKHSLELLEICDDSLKLSKELATEWLQEFMFAGKTESEALIEEAVEFFSDYDQHKTHARPLTPQKLARFNLRITEAEPALRDLLREAHILINGFFSVTAFVKIYENSSGLSWGRQFQQIFLPQPQQLAPHTA
jgi:hypothetical protein